MTAPVCLPPDPPNVDKLLRISMARDRLLKAVMMRHQFDPESLPRGLRILADAVAAAEEEG